MSPGGLEPERDSGPSLESQVTAIIHEVGVPAHIKGYQYLREAILVAVEDMDVINAVTKVLYPEVAKRFVQKSRIYKILEIIPNFFPYRYHFDRSPIIYHTHVLVNDPTRGYGILAESMLRQATGGGN
mgnify:CR=1 FL=1